MGNREEERLLEVIEMAKQEEERLLKVIEMAKQEEERLLEVIEMAKQEEEQKWATDVKMPGLKLYEVLKRENRKEEERLLEVIESTKLEECEIQIEMPSHKLNRGGREIGDREEDYKREREGDRPEDYK